jgi:iron complex transport system substrate-binding protein
MKFFVIIFLSLIYLNAFAYTIKDDTNEFFDITRKPLRIISLAPSITEILFSLGLEKNIVGVTSFCDFPEKAKSITKIGGFTNPNIEKIIELSPDLIIGTTDGNSKNAIYNLRQNKLTVFVVGLSKISDITRTIDLIGKITHKKNEAINLANNIKNELNTIKNKLKNEPKPKIFYALSLSPLVTLSKGSYIDELIAIAGGVNIVKNSYTRYPRYSLEKIIEATPDIILISSDDKMKDEYIIKFQEIFKENKVKIINSDLISRPGPRIIEGLKILAKIFHPNVFKE